MNTQRRQEAIAAIAAALGPKERETMAKIGIHRFARTNPRAFKRAKRCAGFAPVEKYGSRLRQ